LGRRSPEIAFKTVLLPAPLGPSTLTISPGATASETHRPEIGLDDLRVLADLGRRALGDLGAEVQRHDAIGERHQHLHVVLDDDDGHALPPQPLDQLDQLRDGALVDAAGHLVEQQQPRPGRHRPGQLEALALPGAERVGVGLALVQQADEVERRQRMGARLAPVRRVLHHPDHDVVLHRHLPEGSQLLEGAGDPEPVDPVGPEADD
jgi:hypothetical protein